MIKRGLTLIWILFVIISCQIDAEDNVPSETINLFSNPTPLSVAFNEVLPEPGSTVLLDDSLTQICVIVAVAPLLEPGDNLSRIVNLSITVDENLTLAAYDGTHYGNDSLIEKTFDDEYARGPMSDTTCWKVELQEGLHIVTAMTWSTSGDKEFSYTWVFKVVETS